MDLAVTNSYLIHVVIFLVVYENNKNYMNSIISDLWETLEFYLSGAEVSLNSGNPENLRNH